MNRTYNNAIDQLDAEWPLLCADPSAAAIVTGWLTGAGIFTPGEAPRDLGAVLPELECRDRELGREHSDRWLGAVLRHVTDAGPDGRLAARLVVQAMLPGAASTAYRMRRFGHGLDDVVHVVVAALYEVVRRYPLERRPRKIAANLLLDTVKAAHGELARDACDSSDQPLDHERVTVPDPQAGPDEVALRRELAAAAAASGLPGLADVDPEDVGSARGQVIELLLWALSRRVLDRAAAAAISAHYQVGAPKDEIAARRAGVRPASLRQRRSRAVRELAAAAGQWAEEVA
ncbi:hypothetical protein RVR_P17 (plasmid) [Actinacidiphila reveromycinica]|uniref:Sigma-70 family RNA polymerase sigma factor n=1 Tax=Actinacidiphila reveromycinica TaxID=659352 RepID=A0A7U3VU80_9ACTN|nr:hypothetical protein [Streptomyces sp. SN-593]BBG20639.1 hypothetical protein RVR_P17 [Streptomyces sp. SN-593]